MQNSWSHVWKQVPIQGVSLEKDDLKKIFRVISFHQSKLLEKRKEEWDAQNIDKSSREAVFGKADQDYKATIIVELTDGESIIGIEDSIFDSEQISANVASVVIDSNWRHKSSSGSDLYPNVEFKLSLFDNAIFNPNFNLSVGSANESYFRTCGADRHWCRDVSDGISKIIQNRSNYRDILHKKFFSDFLLMLVVLPSVILFLYKNNLVLKNLESQYSLALLYVLYFLLMISILTLFRFIFDFVRFMLPIVEVKEFNSRKRNLYFWIGGVLPISGILTVLRFMGVL